MASEPIRDPVKDQLSTPQNSAFVAAVEPGRTGIRCRRKLSLGPVLTIVHNTRIAARPAATFQFAEFHQRHEYGETSR